MLIELVKYIVLQGLKSTILYYKSNKILHTYNLIIEKVAIMNNKNRSNVIIKIKIILLKMIREN